MLIQQQPPLPTSVRENFVCTVFGSSKIILPLLCFASFFYMYIGALFNSWSVAAVIMKLIVRGD